MYIASGIGGINYYLPASSSDTNSLSGVWIIHTRDETVHGKITRQHVRLKFKEMQTQPKTPEYYLIDVTNPEELIYIARKLGCNVSDILTAVEILQTNERSAIFSYIIDGIFKGHIKQNSF